MKVELKKKNGKVLFSMDSETVKEVVEYAVKTGIKLGGVDLRNVDLRQANLEGGDFRYAYLPHCNLQSANLKNANFEGANLYQAFMYDVYASGANFSYANLKECFLTSSILHKIKGKRVGFTNASLQECEFFYAELEEANFCNANLTGANFYNANLTNAKLYGANLMYTCFMGANVSGINKYALTPLMFLYDQPGLIRAYKLVNSEMESPFFGGIVYEIGKSYEVKANTDDRVRCGKGINVATLDWCIARWCEGERILVVEFEAKDIASIPIGTDGKFRVSRCKVVGEKDLSEIGVVRKGGEKDGVCV